MSKHPSDPEPLSDEWFDDVERGIDSCLMDGPAEIDWYRASPLIRQVAAAALRYAADKWHWPDPDANEIRDEIRAKADEIERGEEE